MPLIHAITQLHAIFIFWEDETTYEQWAKEWSKIRGVFTKNTPICEVLKLARQYFEQNTISISFIPTKDDASSKSLDRLDPMFMHTQLMKEILLTIIFKQQHFEEYINYCCQIFSDNEAQLENVNKFQHDYRNKTSI
jgi:hypothetical protein